MEHNQGSFRGLFLGVFKRGVSPSFKNLPLPKGKGIKGMGLQIISNSATGTLLDRVDNQLDKPDKYSNAYSN